MVAYLYGRILVGQTILLNILMVKLTGILPLRVNQKPLRDLNPPYLMMGGPAIAHFMHLALRNKRIFVLLLNLQ
ncbi:Uncharacterised protein [Salmonella enterica subsp. diarizonae]|nr:Uncharacterised protein [Salmonella enterica subsp. diarizonae]